MEKLRLIKSYLEKVNAQDIKIYDLRGVSSLFDYVFIATVDVARQAAALVDYINKAKKTNEIEFRNMNGEGSNWTLVDLNDILLNIFTYEERIHYDLERLYIDVPLINLEESKVEELEQYIEALEEENDELTSEIQVLEEIVDELIEESAEEILEVKKAPVTKLPNKKIPIKKIEENPNPINVNVDLNLLTLPALKELCKQYSIKGYSALKKAEIIQLILDNFEQI